MRKLLRVLDRGALAWNDWRTENRKKRPDLRGADLRGKELNGANLRGAKLEAANLDGSSLVGVDLSDADLVRASMRDVDLRRADLKRADLGRADLTGSNLRDADLTGARLTRAKLIETRMSGAVLHDARLNKADLTSTDLRGASLTGASLLGSNLTHAALINADIRDATIEESVFFGTCIVGIDLSSARLGKNDHRGPSSVAIDTLELTAGGTPTDPGVDNLTEFLRDAGVPEEQVAMMHARRDKGFDAYSCFISYSHEDEVFARRVHNGLKVEGIRCWMDRYDSKIGQPLDKELVRSVRRQDKFVMCCSQHAFRSEWVTRELTAALEMERDRRESGTEDVIVLLPLHLDDSYLSEAENFGVDLAVFRQRFGGDFAGWEQDERIFRRELGRLVTVLRRNPRGSGAAYSGG